ncbi:MAG: hypothetical protein Q7U92_14255, partial [Bradyrhizobium sp.]|nr:hypothetical protein [Bradyrhizobium sp.]
MVSRALSLATVTLLIGCLAAIPVRAQNLDAGKSPSQIFSGTCTACHKAPRGLVRSMSPGSLPGFLRQHYTTSSEMASQLSAFLIANGATDTRGAKQQAKDPRRPGPTQEAARPDAEPQQAARQESGASDPEGRKAAAKQKLSKRGKEEPSRDEPAKDDAPKGEAGKETAKETAKETSKETGKEAGKDDAARPSGEAASQSAAIAPPKETVETPALRPDPVPPVTPAPPSMS